MTAWVLALAVGVFAGWIARESWSRKGVGKYLPPDQFYQHNKTGDRYKLIGWAVTLGSSSTKCMILRHMKRDVEKETNEVWPVELMSAELVEIK
jgi:hypothetical protein